MCKFTLHTVFIDFLRVFYYNFITVGEKARIADFANGMTDIEIGDFVNIVVKIIILIVGAAITVNGIGVSLVSNFNVGILLTFLLGAVLLAVGALPHLVLKKIPVFIFWLLGIGIMIVIAFVAFLLIFGSHDNVTKKEDAVIVLGAAVHGDRPSAVLVDRLDTAVEYYEQNKNAVIVVTGGRGMQENITEASAMEKYLINKGIPKEKIIKEEKATSTFENFVYSKEILDEMFENGYTAAYITNEYHIYRAGAIAKTAGFGSLTHKHSTTRWHSLVPGTLRECLGVIKYWVFKK